jgi:hypothetical protein
LIEFHFGANRTLAEPDYGRTDFGSKDFGKTEFGRTGL